jgi:hypothetical protein
MSPGAVNGSSRLSGLLYGGAVCVAQRGPTVETEATDTSRLFGNDVFFFGTHDMSRTFAERERVHASAIASLSTSAPGSEGRTA